MQVTQSIAHGATASFSLFPATGYHAESATGCGGSLSGTTYTAGAIIGECTVAVSFALDQPEIGASVDGGHGTVTPDAQTVACGSSAIFTLVPDAGYAIGNIDGTCPPVRSTALCTPCRT